MRPIILEGPDGIGKSTAVQRLRFMMHDRFSCEPAVEHLSREHVENLEDEEQALFYFKNILFDTHTKAGGYSIWDRFHLGSWVYGYENKLHKTWIEGEAPFARVAREIMKNALVVVLFDGERYTDRITRIFKEREEMFDVAQCVAVNESYQDLSKYAMEDEDGVVDMAHIFHDVDYIGYPIDAQLEYWIEEASK